MKKDLTTMLSEVKAMADSYEDPGPILDLISWKDLETGHWKVIVDVANEQDLSNQSPMSPFKVNNDVSDLGFGSEVTYCVQVYGDGDVVSIVTDAGSHGTHVAGIIGANFEGEVRTIS